MTSRSSYYFKERKDRLLGVVVAQYIKTITPVSSGFIASNNYLDASSATIRNILAELESDGLLTHPHTSSGRVPTQSGYRYYVDHLMNEIQLLEEEKTQIQREYQESVTELEILLDKTSQVISDITNYTSIISIDGEHKLFCKGTGFIVEYPEIPDLQRIRYILNALEEKEQILDVINRDLEKKIQVYIGEELECEEFDGCSLAISSYQKKDGPSGRIAVLGPTRMNYERVVSTLEYISNVMNEIL